MTGRNPSHTAGQDFAARGPHPADASAEAALRRMVDAGRARNVSWANLAKMTGRCEADLRKLGGGR